MDLVKPVGEDCYKSLINDFQGRQVPPTPSPSPPPFQPFKLFGIDFNSLWNLLLIDCRDCEFFSRKKMSKGDGPEDKPRDVIYITTYAYEDQKPGTSGLRRPTRDFVERVNYSYNFIHSTISCIEGRDLLIVGGDGRCHVPYCAIAIVKIAAGHGFRKVIIGKDALFSTPAVSNLIRKYKANGGFILTASHNPGGIEKDFGIKYNIANGGPAPESFTNKVYELTKTITKFKICPSISPDWDEMKTLEFKTQSGPFTIDIIDPVDDYLLLMKEIFDFEKLKTFLAKPDFKILIDSLNGVMGPYSRRIFVEELGCSPDSVVNDTPLIDFGGKHPDPNLVYAADLVNSMKTGDYAFGAAFDGDGDRNMILGAKGFFVCPSDSLAVIGANLEVIPYFKKTGVKGFARSMPTAGAIDRVAAKLGKKCYEVPTGWKYFGNLMDKGLCSLCGEESFGTGSDHIREKDGLWAVLAWLSILAEKNKSVEEVVVDHWKTYGRNFFTRYDYDSCANHRCYEMMTRMERLIKEKSLIGKEYGKYTVASTDNFEYKDPVDGSITTKQGLRIIFTDGSRVIMRLSGTGVKGSTVRLYVDRYVNDPEKLTKPAEDILKPLIDVALEIFEIEKYTRRSAPTVIT